MPSREVTSCQPNHSHSRPSCHQFRELAMRRGGRGVVQISTNGFDVSPHIIPNVQRAMNCIDRHEQNGAWSFP